MGMRGHYVELDSEDMTAVLDNRRAAMEMLLGGGSGGSGGGGSGGMAMPTRILGPVLDAMKGGAAKSPSTAKKIRYGIEIEKSWHGLHFILNGDPWKGTGALSHVVLGGTEVGEDAGYGRPRYVNPFQVVQVSTALERISDEDFEARVQNANFAGKGIYCYEDSVCEDDVEELLFYFNEVKKFFREVANRGNGVLVGIV